MPPLLRSNWPRVLRGSYTTVHLLKTATSNMSLCNRKLQWRPATDDNAPICHICERVADRRAKKGE